MTASNLPRTRQYLRAVEAMGPFEIVAEFLAPDVTFREFPNRIAPHGRTRNAAEAREAYAKGHGLLQSQTYEVRSMVEAGDVVAAELEWTGVLAVSMGALSAGTAIKASVAMFLTFRDGKIVSQRNYDCYPPFDSFQVNS